MALDIRTLFIVAIPVGLLFAAVQLAAWSARREDKALQLWGLANLVGMVSASLIAIHAALPKWVWTTGASTGLVASGFIVWAGMRSFAGKPAQVRASAFAIAAFVILYTVVPAVSDNFGARTIVASLFLAGTNAAIATELAQAQRKESLRARSFLVIVFALNSVFYAYRSWAARHYATDGHILQSDTLETLTLLTANFKVIAWNLGALLMVNERLNNRLLHAAICDALTNLLNRAGFRELSGRQVQRSQRDYKPVSVLLMDIDHFKKVNDRFGHDAGDSVLCSFADTARKALRPTDLLARQGGEEFCALLPDTDAASALAIAERVRTNFEGTVTDAVNQLITVTVSIGVAALRTPDERIEAALSRADTALYLAKAEGRNRVRLAEG